MGRIWYDDGNSALFSILIKEAPNVNQMTDLTLLTAISLHKFLQSLGIEIKIKSPNDIIHENLKLAGILLESIILEQEVEAVIIGIGINVNQKEFVDTIEKTATSIHLITSKLYDVTNLIKTFANLFYYDYQEYLKTSLLDQTYLNHYLVK
jgi:BirA family transcriptional regulator, biotin operon repressor / biotin---[acetyl-CoA-carboxylase] ligase